MGDKLAARRQSFVAGRRRDGTDRANTKHFRQNIAAFAPLLISWGASRVQAPGLYPRRSAIFLMCFAVSGSLVATLVFDRALSGLVVVTPEQRRILALQILSAGSFALLIGTLIGSWLIVRTRLLSLVLGNTSSGDAIPPPPVTEPFAFLSNWLLSGATVTPLRGAIYLYGYQHVHRRPSWRSGRSAIAA